MLDARKSFAWDPPQVKKTRAWNTPLRNPIRRDEPQRTSNHLGGAPWTAVEVKERRRSINGTAKITSAGGSSGEWSTI